MSIYGPLSGAHAFTIALIIHVFFSSSNLQLLALVLSVPLSLSNVLFALFL